MILKVSPTRISLLNLKKELKVAKKGHKLLKDKRDGLIKKFMTIIFETRDLRQVVEERLGRAFDSYQRSSAMTSRLDQEIALLVPNAKTSLEVGVKNVMSVKIPEFKISKEGSAFSYGFTGTTGDLDNAIVKFDEVFVDIVRLAALEKTAENLAEEIEKTRRRVSALENVMIPNLEETIKFITMQLDERARDAVVSTMRVKAMIVAKEG
ncbi:MAG: V-type ATP synthase subunit D [Candidatus Nomurabacteria bacterium]|nr:V-type ATP synthase subunit D [Candidatus Nomurabacteria bacterium]USN88024.1 MAG: V-type ATP synthase subunit D [Candidatus Nomurabacteria bacterium]